MKEIKTRITAYKGKLVIETKDPEKDEDFLPAGDMRIGCVLSNTEERLGISEEALKLLKQVKTSGDDIGDVDCFVAANGMNIFAWLGPGCRLVDPETAEGSRTYNIDDIKFKTIQNEVPEEAIKAIDK